MNEIAKRSQLSFPGCLLTATGLIPDETLTREQWEETGRRIGEINRAVGWVTGDWLLIGENGGYLERGKLEEACERFGVAYSTAKDAVVTCRAIEQRLRRPTLPYTHHRQVANRDDADELLDWCEETGASVQDLRAEKRRRSKEASRIAPPEGKYRVLYADPPWQYNSGDQHTRTSQDTVLGSHYPSMSLEDICALPIRDLAHDNAVLFLWATAPLNKEAVSVCEALGFEYKTACIWDKVKHNVGHYFSVRHEMLFVCTRGSCTPDSNTLFNSVQRIERGEHSVKPEKFYEIIETMYTQGPYIELFARNKRKGWEAWGNEAENGVA